MRNSFDGARSHPPAPFRPGPDESGPRPIPQRQPDQDQTRQIDEAALEYINRRRDAQVEPTSTQETNTYSAERLNERLDLYRARHVRGGIDEIKETYALNKDVEPTRVFVRPEVTEVMDSSAASAAAYRREYERTGQRREGRMTLAAQPPIIPNLNEKIEGIIERRFGKGAIPAARPAMSPDFNKKLDSIIEKRLGKDAVSSNRPRVVVTGVPPAPLRLAKLMERAHEEPTEIEDLTEFAQEM